MTTLARYICHERAYWYLARGWRVQKMLGHHGRYSLLATKRVRRG